MSAALMSMIHFVVSTAGVIICDRINAVKERTPNIAQMRGPLIVRFILPVFIGSFRKIQQLIQAMKQAGKHTA